MEVIEGLDPDVLTRIMTFLNIPDRLECRLACRELRAQCPSPWRLAGDVLEAVNAFDVCSECTAKRSFAAGPERPDDPRFNELRLEALACDCSAEYDMPGCQWAWRGDAEEAALNGTDVCCSFARSDPRRTPAYADLMRRVSARSYATLDDWLATGPFTRSPSPEAERLRELLMFSRGAALRLRSHHELNISSSLELEAGSLARWSAPYIIGEADGTAIVALEVAHKEEPCAYNIVNDLASLHVATEELLQSREYPRAIYWFGEDSDDGRRINTLEGSSLRDKRSELTIFVFDEGRELAGATPCSDAHFEYLLAPKGPLEALTSMFGDAICEKLPLDPMARLRASWPDWSQVMRGIDADFPAQSVISEGSEV